MGEFTPGPWRFQIHDPDLPGDSFILSTVDMDTSPDGLPQDYGHSILEGGLVCPDDGENSANAHLIAAAPELYEALRALCGAPWDLPEDELIERVMAGRTTLARARGEQP